jgi:hypothetical protein
MKVSCLAGLTYVTLSSSLLPPTFPPAFPKEMSLFFLSQVRVRVGFNNNISTKFLLAVEW